MPDPRPSWSRRLRLPLAGFALLFALWAALRLMDRFEVGLQYQFPLGMVLQLLSVAVTLLTVGWFALAGWIPRWVKLLTAGLAVLAAVAGLATVRTVEFDGQMQPHVRFRWEPTADAQLHEYRINTPGTTDAADWTVGPDDSPFFRGPNRDGTAPVKLADDWTASPPKLVWKHPVGGGHAGIAVAGNSLVTIEQRGTDEAVVYYDRLTGRERGGYRYATRFATSEPMGGDGPRTTPSVVDGRVYALGAAGQLNCLDGRTGSPIWQANTLLDAGATNIDWGQSGSPLVTDGLVVVNPGVDPKNNQGRAVIAYDARTGAQKWANGQHPTAYASPERADFGGVTQAVVFDAAGVGGYALADGRELWRHPWKTDMGMNSAQPVRVGPDRLFVSSERSNGGAVLEVGPAVREVWRGRALSARFASPVFHAGHLFGLTAGRLVCVDAATGKQKWADGDYGNGQLVLADNKLVITAEKGFVALVRADPGEFAELGRVPVFADRTWNVPALAGRHLFLRNHREIACLELP